MADYISIGDPDLLDYSFTLINKFDDENEDGIYLNKTFINNCVKRQTRYGFTVSSLGAQRVVSHEITLITVDTRCFYYDEDGHQVIKEFMDFHEWKELEKEQREKYYTLRHDDLIIEKKFIDDDVSKVKTDYLLKKYEGIIYTIAQTSYQTLEGLTQTRLIYV